jgi:hypothetical protein
MRKKSYCRKNSSLLSKKQKDMHHMWCISFRSVCAAIWLASQLRDDVPSRMSACGAAENAAELFPISVLKQAGFPQAHSAAVVQLYNQLRTIHGTSDFKLTRGGDATTADVLAKQAKPGHVLLAFNEPPNKPNLGTHAHCGIVGPDGQIFTNDWTDGIWKLAEFQWYFYWYKHLYIIRLP